MRAYKWRPYTSGMGWVKNGKTVAEPTGVGAPFISPSVSPISPIRFPPSPIRHHRKDSSLVAEIDDIAIFQ
jgi:hypothetical protein